MKRIFTFPELSPGLQAAAVAKVQRLAEGTARYRGEIWVESSRELAEAARFSILRNSYGEPAAIWDVRFAKTPTVLPGTEERKAA